MSGGLYFVLFSDAKIALLFHSSKLFINYFSKNIDCKQLKQNNKQKEGQIITIFVIHLIIYIISRCPADLRALWGGWREKKKQRSKSKKTRQGANLVGKTSANFLSCQTNKTNLKYNGRRQLTGETV